MPAYDPFRHKAEYDFRERKEGDPKKRLEFVALKAAIEQMKEGYAFSERRACGLVMVAVSTYRYETRRSDEPLRTRVVQLARRSHVSGIGVCTCCCSDVENGSTTSGCTGSIARLG